MNKDYEQEIIAKINAAYPDCRMKSELVSDEGYKGQSHWLVTITNGTFNLLTTEYHQGSAYRYHTVDRSGLPLPSDSRRKITIPYGRITISDHERLYKSKPLSPRFADVLYCLNTDSQTVSDGQIFSDWASEFGYDEDSRKAFRMFNACRDNYFGMIGLDLDLEVLSEIFEGW